MTYNVFSGTLNPTQSISIGRPCACGRNGALFFIVGVNVQRHLDKADSQTHSSLVQ